MILALVSGLAPVSGFHKFYLGQRGWGIAYLVLSLTPFTFPIPHLASLVELVWYLLQEPEEFDRNFNGGIPSGSGASVAASQAAQKVTQTSEAIAAMEAALRTLEQLRQDGLISELEFEDKRRSLLNQMPR